MRELLEMQYQFEEPFIVDSSKIAAKLGVHATPIDQALADTLTSYRTAVSGTHPKPSARGAAGTMMAIVHTAYGPAPEHVLRFEEVDKPAMDRRPGPRASARGQRGPWHLAHHGRPAVPHPGRRLRTPQAEVLNPGRSLAGTVEIVGKKLTDFKPGDDVFGICDGSFAEYVCVRTHKSTQADECFL